ncbi:U3 small nucleolar ribonucleoprotein protein MPP10-like [Zingiber officinale]|uniref:U3 small nucleolar ribonucleoprotein protein MPP10-like n=1 Tax=Zingiber officinale TaxID=94328 RepID=UPI001C4B4C21|nr:U3 small nucleolar ribonucleoprotein protein MPP10-like [Zingiber officinale]
MAAAVEMEKEEESPMKKGEEALERLRSADPPLYLMQSSEFARDARAASCFLFSSLVPFCTKLPIDRLLVEGFDAEQIWYQIDLLSRPLLSTVRREFKRLEEEHHSRAGLSTIDADGDGEEMVVEKDEISVDDEGDEEDGDESEEKGSEDEEDGEDDDEDDGEGDEEEEEEAGEAKGNVVEDKFLKMQDLENYLENAEAKEYGHPVKKGSGRKEKDDDTEEEEDDMDLEDFDSDGDEDAELGANARYEDFFGGNKKKQQKKGGTVGKRKRSSTELDAVDHFENTDEDVEKNDSEQKFLSTHEKELQKMRSKIEEMEKANLDPKSWTMQGEVTAAKRPKNSALEVDLDFEHNVRPAPVITEEVTASLEDIIKKRIIEGHFDDVERAPILPSKPPKETKEMDENKSKKGLAEIYEEEYAQKTGLAPALLSTSDKLKTEATMLLKKISLKLDSLSHFHFAPKPVIEDMSIQVNVPALAMEEVAPLAVSDAAMLAPEEIFHGKGNIKEEAELTKEERKRRRANQKRRFRRLKAETSKKAAQKTGQSAVPGATNEKPDS